MASAQAAFAPAALAGPHDALVAKHAAANGVPEQLVHRLIRIESRGNAAAVHRGNYGLMQIRLGTARGVGYSGDAQGLLDPDTNLTYAVRYLAGAYRAAGCDADRTVKYYQRGYYGAAQRECGAALPAAVTTVVDVIKPKVVRTETIATPRSGQAPVRPVGNFEPARVASPPAQPVLASIPLPPARPELGPAPKPTVQTVQRPGRVHKRANRTSKATAQAKIESTPKIESSSKIEDPTGVVSFLKKLVTPDKKARKRSEEASADPPSQIQAPQ